MDLNFRNHDGIQHFIKKGYMLQDRNEKDYYAPDYCLIRSDYNHFAPIVNSQGYDTGADPSTDYGSIYPQKVAFSTVFTQPYTHDLEHSMESDAHYAEGIRIDYYTGTLTFYEIGYFNNGSKGREVPLYQYEWSNMDSDREDKDEIFNVEFNEWADQELMSHGKDISFKDWAQDEGMKHGNTEITEWAQHEDESHDARYGAETFNADVKMDDQNKDLLKWMEDYLWDNDKKGYQDYHAHRKSLGLSAEDKEPIGLTITREYVRYLDSLPHTKLNRTDRMFHNEPPMTYLEFQDAYLAKMKKRKKRSSLLSEPHEGTSLDSGEWKGILTGFGIGLLGLFGYSKLRK
tara:strand:- start:810 stop:1844 length:1035 start_codon:yes stop_codon:yes gene_type:complete